MHGAFPSVLLALDSSGAQSVCLSQDRDKELEEAASRCVLVSRESVTAVEL